MKQLSLTSPTTWAPLLLALCTGAHAQSSVQLYGVIDEGVGSFKTSGGQRSTQVMSGGMTTSYIGYRGTEDLGGGLKAVFALESYLRVDAGQIGRFDGDPMFSRSSYVGLASELGTLLAGRITTPLFVQTATFNPMGGSFTFSPLIRHIFGAGARVSGDSGWNNAVAYNSPKFGGFSGNLLYAMAEQSGGRNVSAALRYTHSAFDVSLVSQNVQSPFVGRDETTTQLATSYDFTLAKVFASYAQVRRSGSDVAPLAQAMTVRVAQVGVSVPVGQVGAIVASWSQADNNIASPADRTFATIGYTHRLSRRTDLYAMVMSDKIQGNGSAPSTGVGVRHAF